MHGRRRFAASVAALLAAVAATAADPAARAQYSWPQFHGPRRDNISTEEGLLERWPEGGPKLVWKAKGLGHGWATVSVTGGRIYTAGNIDRTTFVIALDLDGGTLWRTRSGPAFKGPQPGARATPTVAAGRVYHLNGTGHIVCLEAATGESVWAVNMLKRFNGRNILWGLAESLLVDGLRVICCPGGEKVAMAALDKDTGRTVWTSTGLGDKPAYVSPVLVEHGGLRQIVTIMANYAVGVAADTGKLLWKYPHKVSHEANCITPVHHDGRLALSGTWGRGSTLLKLTVSGRTCTAEEVWRTRELDSEHGGIVLVDGYLYGQADGNHQRRRLACLDMRTGRTMWTSGRLAGKRSATVTVAGGMLYVLSDRGEVALVRPNPKRLEVVSQYNLPKGGRGAAWAHPVVCGGRLYIRHGEFLYVYDVRGVN